VVQVSCRTCNISLWFKDFRVKVVLKPYNVHKLGVCNSEHSYNGYQILKHILVEEKKIVLIITEKCIQYEEKDILITLNYYEWNDAIQYHYMCSCM